MDSRTSCDSSSRSPSTRIHTPCLIISSLCAEGELVNKLALIPALLPHSLLHTVVFWAVARVRVVPSNQIAWIQLTDTCTQNQKLTEQENHSADQIGKRGLVSCPDFFLQSRTETWREGITITQSCFLVLRKVQWSHWQRSRLSPKNWTVLVSHSLNPVRVRLCSLTPAYQRVWEWGSHRPCGGWNKVVDTT